jgi:hypothetical protein
MIIIGPILLLIIIGILFNYISAIDLKYHDCKYVTVEKVYNHRIGCYNYEQLKYEFCVICGKDKPNDQTTV